MTSCPSVETLHELLAGSLSEVDADLLRRHLDDCSLCLQQLDRLSDDTELRDWRDGDAVAVQRLRRESGCVILLDRLRAAETLTTAAHHTPEEHGPDLKLEPSLHIDDIGMLGPYRIRRELGRGGMGIVLEAFDLELCRGVAIKVMRPDRADEKSRSRFVREAQSAARVKHDHVVTIHSVSNPPGSLPYLVMELVRGPTLRERIASESQLDPGEVAHLIAEIADGLAAAHDAGLVHRDIKPSNIMLDPEHGTLAAPFRAKITDFGLARITSLASSLTHEGTLAGTPSYMSPEQVRNPETLDPRADVYNLGVTMYEALTGEVPFGGALHMVLRQIETDEPRPPRLLNDVVPRDLETICLKAMEKYVSRRYQSARELAEDLRRWERNEPIEARPVGQSERLWRWSRRNPRVAGLSGTVLGLLLLLAIGSTIGLLWVSHAKQETELQRLAAVSSGNRATQSAGQAEASKRLAEQRLGLAIDSLNDLIFKVQTQLSDTSGTLKVRQQLLETALSGLDRITKDAAQSPLADHSLAVAHQRIGDILWLSGRTADARSHFSQSMALAEARLASEPTNILARRDLASAHEKLGVLDQHAMNRSAANEHYGQSLTMRLALSNENPNDVEVLQELAIAHNRLGDVSTVTGKHADAFQHYSDAIKILIRLQDRNPTHGHDLVLTYRRLGWARLALFDFDPAKSYLMQGLELAEKLAASDPDNATWRRDVLLLQHTLGTLLMQIHDFTGAEQAFQKVLKAAQSLAASEPNHAELQYDVALYFNALALAQRASGNLESAAESWHKEREILEQLVERSPTSIKFQNDLTGTYHFLSELQLRFGRHAEQAQWLEKVAAAFTRLEQTGHLQDPGMKSAKVFIERTLTALPLAPQAVQDEGFALDQPRDSCVVLLCLRAYELARLKRHQESASTAEKVAAHVPVDPFLRAQYSFTIGRSYALCSAAVANGRPADELLGDEQALHERYAQASIDALREATRLDPSQFLALHLDPDLAPIRKHAAYLKMMQAINPKRPTVE